MATELDYLWQQKALQDLVLDPDLEHLEDLLAEFNLFRVLGIERGEVQHSRFLAWLLNPRETHGLGDYFVRHFLKEAAKVAGGAFPVPTPIDVDGWNLGDVEVFTERHRIDILLVSEGDGFACPIENKIGSGEHSEQLRRYLETVWAEYEHLKPFPIFLTPEGIEPENTEDREHWVPLDYGTVDSILQRVLERRRSSLSVDVASFLEQYTHSLGRHVLTTSHSDIEELAFQIYRKHGAAIDLIAKGQPNIQTTAWNFVDTAMAEHALELGPDTHTRSYHRYYSPLLDEIPDLMKGKGWTKSGRVVLFEFKYHENMRLDLVIGPAPEDSEEARRRVDACLLQSQLSMRTRRQLAGKWSIVWSKPILSKQDMSPLNPDIAKPKIDLAIKDFYANDYLRLVNAIRQEFGLPEVGPS